MRRGPSVLLAGNPGRQGPMIRRILARIGCSVKTVSPGEDFLRFVRRSKPDLIILGTMRRQLVEAADRALYQAKSDGRNCVRGVQPVLSLAHGSSPA